MIKDKIKGFWFFGLAGSGKSFASKLFYKKKKYLIIDGDQVRKLISQDLKYKKKDRDIQINRVLGIAKIVINSGFFPIITTVWMNKITLKEAKKIGIDIIKIERDFKEVKKERNIYKSNKNVVGIDIFFENLKTKKILNTGDKLFWKKLKKLI